MTEQQWTEDQLWSKKKWAPLRAWLSLVSCLVVLCFICFCVFLVFFPPSLGLLSPYLHTWLSTSKTTPHLRLLCPSTSLCSGDSPEQRSAAAWQRASPVPSLSGDHQWDLHPCTCAKLAGGHPQSHTRHYGVCVASPIHPRPFWPSFTRFFVHPSYCRVWVYQIFHPLHALYLYLLLF